MYRFVETRQIKWVCLGMYLTKLTSDGEDDDKPLNGIRKRISKQSQINSFPLVYLLYPTNEPSKWSHVSPSHGMWYQSSKMLWNQQHSKILVPPSLCGLGSCPAAGLPALNISKYIILANSRVSKLNLECVLTRSSLYVSEYRFNMRSSLNGLPEKNKTRHNSILVKQLEIPKTSGSPHSTPCLFVYIGSIPRWFGLLSRADR